MDANDIINALNHVLDLGDQLDNAGGGVQGLTDGEHTTREVCKIELGQFLLYLANCSSFINAGQAAVLNLVLGDGFSEIPAYKLKELASSISAPDPSNNLTLSAFMQADLALSRQNSNSSSSLTTILISIYKAFGQLLIAMNENAIAHNRYDGFINRLESRASMVGYTNDDRDSSSSGIQSSDDFDIDDNVLTQYTGDDTHIVVPDGIERIGDNAFSDKTSIQTITLPDSVTVIGESAFRHCDNLESINLPEGITEIESDAFTYCDSLTSLDIPSTVDTIGGDAFLFCNHIKRIRFPATLTDIGDDAFMYCSGLESVVVYGGRKSNGTLERLKDHFPVRVKILWEGDETQKAKTAANAKKSPVKKNTSKKTSKSSGKYNDRVSFDLPDDYEFVEGKNNDGERTFEIKVNPSLNDDGETVYDSSFLINIQTPDNVSATKSALDVIQENNKDCVVNRRLLSTPEALIIISSNTSSILGVQFTLNLINLAIELSSKETVSITCVKPKVGEDEESIQPTLDQLETVWKSMSIDGKKVTAADMDIESLMATITEKEGVDKEKGESPIDNHVQQDDNFLVIGNRWRIELPYGIRYRLKKRGEDERFDELLFELDRRTLGHCFLGETLKEQQEAAQSILLILSLNGGGFEELYKVHLRNDEIMDVQLGLKINSSGKTAFEIEVTEKEQAIETRIMMIPPCEIEDKEEAFKKLGDGDLSTEHPLGYEWEQYWKIAVRMASSISSLGEMQNDIHLGPVQTIEGGFTVRMPFEVKSIKMKDTEKIAYLPTTKKLTQNSLNHLSDYPYYMILETGKIDLPSADSDDNQQIPGARSLTSRMLCNALVRKVKNPFSIAIWESVFGSGYKAVYLINSESSMVPEIFILTNDGHFATFQFDSDSDYDPGKIIRIAKTVFKNIHCPNDEEITPIAYPQVPDICHEHLTLMLGGSYTTRRDADFIGQPIRMLMEKCGNTKEEAYDLMLIPNDDYVLDIDARRLAKVFRLKEGMFDPYTDTEAMIRLGMFSDARMFHALRSLAWTVLCKADREERDLESYTFEELAELAKPIDTNHFNYSTESYCSGLCSHYDWRVFYVPDTYLDSDCESSTDLRALCGKENRSGNSTFVVMGGLDGFSAMNRTNNIISRNEETLESLEALRKDLIDLLPIMKTIYDGLMKDRNRSEKLEGVLSDALNAWCALAVAAKEAFYSEEANDSPEVEASLSGPMEQPTDDFDNHTHAKRNNFTPKQTTMKRPSRPVPKGETLDLDGETVIKPGQFAGNMSLRNIVIPEGVTEIGEQAFNSCMFLETVVLPKSLKKIGKMAFMSCRSLRQVEIPEGVEEICDHAFGATNNLKEVYLPNSLQRVDRYMFGLGGDSPYATAYMSGELASRLQAESKDARFMSAISARRYVIDGVGYENMYDYGRPSTSSSGVATGIESKSFNEYRTEMEKACKDDKPLQDMIEAGRKAVYADPNAELFGYKDAFEQAVKNLDRDASVTFSGKHFVLTGFGKYEQDVIAEIEKRGGFIHSSMVKMADYLIVCLDSPGAAKVKKALEWRQKGASNKIISDYQMWLAIFGKVTADSTSVYNSTFFKNEGLSSSTMEKSQPSTEITIDKTEDENDTSAIGKDSKKTVNQSDINSPHMSTTVPPSEILDDSSEDDEADDEAYDDEMSDDEPVMLDLKGAKILSSKTINTWTLPRHIIIPEGVTEIAGCTFMFSSIETVILPKSIKKIGHNAFNKCKNLRYVELNEGLEEMDSWIFDKNLKELKLPDSLKVVDCNALRPDLNDPNSYITVYMSGRLARWLVEQNEFYYTALKVKSCIIDGREYDTLENYVEIAKKEAEQRTIEQRKKEQRDLISAEIQSLTAEMNSLRGLFAGMKRKKLQKQIDALNEQLQNI